MALVKMIRVGRVDVVNLVTVAAARDSRQSGCITVYESGVAMVQDSRVRQV